ncbi:MAG: alkaline phosphatase family protein [Candidatus Micrarchaeia archaeon]
MERYDKTKVKLKSNKNKRGRRKAYLIGIDSVPLSVLKELSGNKGMEAFDELLKTNSIVDLESTLPPITGPAWPSLYTGLNPGEHGVPNFLTITKNYVKELVFFDSHKHKPFWETLADEGHKCLVITPAMITMPPINKNIDMITGFPLPSKPSNEKMGRMMQKYNFTGEVDLEKDIVEGKITLDYATAEYIKTIKKRAGLAKECILNDDYDFVYVCFTETDRIQHYTMNLRDRKKYLLSIYSEISNFVGFILERAKKEDAAVFIVSDHGAQAIYNKFLINTWLINKGYITLKSENTKQKGNILKYKMRSLLMRHKSTLRKFFYKMPHSMKLFIKNTFIDSLPADTSKGTAYLYIFDYNINKTKAFAEVSVLPVCSIWINDKRFDKGIVDEKEKKALKQKLISELKEVKSAEGDKMFVNVIDADEYYKGTKLFIAPDIFAEAKPHYTVDIFTYSKNSIFAKPQKGKSGDHTRYGILGFYPKIKVNNPKITEVKDIIMKYFDEAK